MLWEAVAPNNVHIKIIVAEKALMTTVLPKKSGFVSSVAFFGIELLLHSFPFPSK